MDNGLGMTEDVMKKTFEPLFITNGQKGTGLWSGPLVPDR